MKTTPTRKKALAKLLTYYHGNPAKDLQIIVVSDDILGSLVNEVLLAAGHRSALIAPSSLARLHRSIARSWRDGATHAVISTTSTDLVYGLPVHIAVDLAVPTANLVLNRDSAFFSILESSPSKVITFGSHPSSDIRIDRSKLYKKGTEATLSHGAETVQVATFATGESAVNWLAAATTIAKLLNITPEILVDGLANYEPATPPKDKTNPDNKQAPRT